MQILELKRLEPSQDFCMTLVGVKSNSTMTFPKCFKATSVCIVYCFSAVANADCSTTSPKPFSLPLSNCTIPPNANFQNGVDSWGLQIIISSQNLCAVPSTVVNNSVFTATELCTQNNDGTSNMAQCISRMTSKISHY
jgi:hypothetical protein